MSFRILSIDGGGIRGIIPGKLLIQLESEIRTQYGNNKNIVTIQRNLIHSYKPSNKIR